MKRLWRPHALNNAAAANAPDQRLVTGVARGGRLGGRAAGGSEEDAWGYWADKSGDASAASPDGGSSDDEDAVRPAARWRRDQAPQLSTSSTTSTTASSQ